MPKRKTVNDGPANFYVQMNPGNGTIVISFERPITWCVLSPEVAIKLGEQLIENAKQINASREGRA